MMNSLKNTSTNPPTTTLQCGWTPEKFHFTLTLRCSERRPGWPENQGQTSKMNVPRNSVKGGVEYHC